uniref:ANIS5_cation-bd domain-containing protein n=1 Tax=Haemonchus contortus TaxID=6289 RepID=A0A7I4YHP5_HAECO
MEVSWQAQQDYHKIVYNQDLTIAQQKKEVMLWAKKYNLAREVVSFFGKIEERMNEINQNLAKLVGELPKALKTLTNIMKNEKQTVPNMKRAMDKLKLDHPQAFHVLMAGVMEIMRKHGPHGPYPHGGSLPLDGPNAGNRKRKNSQEKSRSRRYDRGHYGGWPNIMPEETPFPFGQELR